MSSVEEKRRRKHSYEMKRRLKDPKKFSRLQVARTKRWRLKNRDKYLAMRKRHRDQHKEQIVEYMRKYQESHRTKINENARTHYQKHRTEILERAKEKRRYGCFSCEGSLKKLDNGKLYCSHCDWLVTVEEYETILKRLKQ